MTDTTREINLRDYDVSYFFNEARKRAEVRVIFNSGNDAVSSEVVGLIYKTDERSWRVCGDPSGKDYYDLLAAVKTAIKLNAETCKVINDVRALLRAS